MAYGVTAEGFVKKTGTEIREERRASFRSRFGANVNVHESSRNGNFIDMQAEREEALWDLAHAVYNGFDPDKVSDAQQDGLYALTGSIRHASARSTVDLILAGVNGTSVAAGKQVSDGAGGPIFETTETGVIATAVSWAAATAYVVGDRRKNGSNIYEVITAGTSAGSGGPVTTTDDETDGTVHWKWVIAGTAFIEVAAQSLNTGPKPGLAGTLTSIGTSVSGWAAVRNLEDAELGSTIESRSAFRLRREQEIRAAGNAAFEAVRAKILKVDGVTACTMFQNESPVTDGDGLPPHSFEAVVLGGDEQEIRDAIFASKPLGIRAYGDVAGLAADAQGVDHQIDFSRPDDIDIYVTIHIKTNSSYPADGDDQIEEEVVGWANENIVGGKDVVSSLLGARVPNVSGISDVVSVLIGTAPSPTLETTIVVGTREIARFDTSRTVVIVDGAGE